VGRVCSTHGKGVHTDLFVGKLKGKRTLGRHTWEDNIKMDLREKDGGMD
jgi:hypothetical protein